MPRPKFKKGNKLAGSRKGIPNRWTKEFKTNVENCFNEMGDMPKLLVWAKKHPGEFYTKLWAKLAPLQVTGQVKVDHESEFEGAAELFARLISDGAAAITARRHHLKLIEGKTSDDRKDTAHVGDVRKA